MLWPWGLKIPLFFICTNKNQVTILKKQNNSLFFILVEHVLHFFSGFDLLILGDEWASYTKRVLGVLYCLSVEALTPEQLSDAPWHEDSF